MKKVLLAIALGLAVYLLSLVVLLPASLVFKPLTAELTKRVPGLTLIGVEGEIWDGRIRRVSYRDSSLGSAEWSLSPLPLLLGRVDIQWRLEDGSDYLNGALAVSLLSGEKIDMEGLEGRLAVDRATAFIPYVPVVPTGSLALRLEHTAIEAGHISTMEGKIVWSGAGLSAPQSLDFGTLTMEITPLESGGVRGRVADQGGPLSLSGELTLDQQGAYQFDGQLAAGPGAKLELQNALKLLGRPDSAGRFRVNRSGRL